MDIVLANTVGEAVRRKGQITSLIGEMKASWADCPFGTTTLIVPRVLLPKFIAVAESELEEINHEIESL